MAMTTAVSPERRTLIKTICGTPIQKAALPSPQSAGFKYCAIEPKSDFPFLAAYGLAAAAGPHMGGAVGFFVLRVIDSR